MTLPQMMAKACAYAQDHIDDLTVWPPDASDRELHLQCTSYQMACFFAQNTVRGDNGVEWDVVNEELVAHPGKSEAQWLEIIEKIARQLGGWK